MAHPAYTTGRYDSLIPVQLQERARAVLADPDILSLRAELALCTVRIAELLGTLNAGDAGAELPGALRAAEDLREATEWGDHPRREDALQRLLRAVTDRGAARGVWAEVRGWLEQYRRLADSEVARLTAMQAVVTHEQLVGVIGALVAIVADHVRDRDTLRRIVDAVGAQLLGRPGAPASRFLNLSTERATP